MFFSLFLIILKYLFITIPILISVAIFTLFERKVIGFIQRRKGPNIVGFFGLLQPISDGLKLMIKEPIIPLNSNKYMYIAAPIIALLLSLVNWVLIPFDKNILISDLNIGFLFILGISSLGVYGVILAGWSSNSKYAFLGALRSAAQMISYEVSIGIILITVALSTGSLNLTDLILSQEDIWFIFPFFPLFFLFLISSIAETNRHPFDLPEAEAELVSGYNVEYASVGFAFFFIGEYANIILMSAINVIFFFRWLITNKNNKFFFIPNFFWFSLKLIFMIFIFILVRAMLPRYRYDQLMGLGWKIFLPLSLAFFLFYSGIFIGFNLLP